MAARLNDELAVLDDQDESVRIAVRALGDMRNSGRGNSLYQASPSSSFQPTPALSVTSRSSSPSLPSPSVTGDFSRERDNEAQVDDTMSPDFVSRVSHFPIVNSALRVYEVSKASSRVVKYGAEMMESSVRSISRPVIERLPVNQLDEFACRQLDRLESYGRPTQSQDTPRSQFLEEDDYVADQNRDYDCRTEDERAQGSRDAWSSSIDSASASGVMRGRIGRRTSPERWKGKDRDISMIREDESGSPPKSSEMHSRTPTPRQDQQDSQQQQQVVQRSRWQAMLLEAGGIGAAVSEESMRRLKYCLQWLQYATAHIDQQILILRDFIASLQQHSSSPTSPHAQHLQTLTAIRRDVVSTIRQVVDVVSKYAGGALPEPARARVRSFILCLPERWAKAASDSPSSSATNGIAKPDGAGKSTKGERTGRTTRAANARASAAPYTYGPGEPGPSPRSRPASRATSPSHSRTAVAAAHAGAGGVVPMQHAAQKILTLAMESLDMLRAVTQVFKDSLDKADAWVERLRIVGIQRPNVEVPTLPPPSALLSPNGSPNTSQPPSTPITAVSHPSPSSTSTSPISSTSSTFTSSGFLTPPTSLSSHPSHTSLSSISNSRTIYREPLPPISLSPASSNAPSPSPMSPYSNLRELQLPPLGPGAYAHTQQQQQPHSAHPHPHSEFGALSLNGGSSAGSRSLPVSGYATPRSATSTTMGTWAEAEDRDRVWDRERERERERESVWEWEREKQRNREMAKDWGRDRDDERERERERERRWENERPNITVNGERRGSRDGGSMEVDG
ncbi:unnamed protein product [Somion occarium]|uniref:Opi1-domain-containing protein n=1 Tax=Somion occarium TaxID=3059160 RepID=A0ABP1E675_9APHY